MKKRLPLLFFLLCFAYGSYAQTPTTYYVKTSTDGGDDNNNSGTSWGSAYATLQTAINAASFGDSIFVKKGEYSLTQTITMKDSVKIYGSFSGTESSLSQRVLGSDSTELVRPSTATSEFRIITNDFTAANPMTAAAVLDGFVIRGGNLSGNNNNGGGIYNKYASPTLGHLTLSGNMAYYGGGMYNDNSSSPILTNVTLSGNTADVLGGGMHNRSSSPILTNVILSGNEAYLGGGGVSNRNNSSPTLTNVTLSGNTAYFIGGGMYNGNSSNPQIRNSIILGNTADNDPGIYNESSTPEISYSLVQGMDGSSGTGNISSKKSDGSEIPASEVFIDYQAATASAATTAGDYRLKSGSVVLNKGEKDYFSPDSIPNLSAISTDLAGEPRVEGSGIDLGAYESALPKLKLLGNNTLIAAGDLAPSLADSTHFGTQKVTSGSLIRTFSLQNSGPIPSLYLR